MCTFLFISLLIIQYPGTLSSRAALSFQPLHVLRHLNLVHRRHTPRHNPSNTHPHGTVQDMINLLSYSQLPQSLSSVSINISLTPLYGNVFYPEMPSSDLAYQGSTESAMDGINTEQAGGPGPLVAPGFVGDPVICGHASHPAKSMTTSSIPSIMTIIKRVFAPWSPESNNLKPLDDLLGDFSQDRFAGIRYLVFRLEVQVHKVPRECPRSSEQRFAEQAAQYVRSQFFPKVKERFERVGRSSGGFWVVVLPRFRRLA